jgi:hypothetical protein
LGLTRFSTRGFFRAKQPFSFVSIHFATSRWRNKWYRQKEKGLFTEKKLLLENRLYKAFKSSLWRFLCTCLTGK